MNKLNENKDYGRVYGHDTIHFVQDGRNYDASGELIEDAAAMKNTPVNSGKEVDKIIETNDVANAKAFLTTLLGQGPMKKNVVFAEADRNNQQWDNVLTAAALMGVSRTTQGTGAVKWEQWTLKQD